MRKALLTAGIIIGVVVVVIIGALIYAVVNLNGIIQDNRALILSKASGSIGRKVEVDKISASLGWGVVADLSGVTIADDPRFSDKPFVKAADVYAKVAFLPLLRRQVRVERLSLSNPVIHIIRNQSGQLNISTIGKKLPAAKSEAPPAPVAPSKPAVAPKQPLATAPLTAEKPKKPATAGALSGLSITSLAVSNGTITYKDASAPEVRLRAVNLDVEDLSLDSPFKMKLSMAALGERKNISLTSRIGPVLKNGAIDIGAIPLMLNLDVGPVTMAELRAVPQLAKAIPPAVSITNPITASVKLDGTPQKMGFNLIADLTGNQVVYKGVLDKGAGVALKLTAAGTHSAGSQTPLEIGKAALTLGDLKLQAGQIQFGPKLISARIDSNRFDLASLGKMLVALSKYNTSGKAELHAKVKIANKKPEADGVLTLASVTVVPPGKPAILRDLTGDIKMAGNSAVVGPLKFNLGSGHGQLQANVRSLQPINATYSFNANVIKPAELTASAKSGTSTDRLDQPVVQGTIRGTASAPEVTANVTSPGGILQNAAYKNLAVNAAYGQKRVTISSIKVGIFNGKVDGKANATLGAQPAFDVALNLQSIGLKQALLSQKSKAADMVRGQLTGQVRVAGQGNTFDRIKPTLKGDGRISVANAKLLGVNVVAQAMRKVQGVPGIDTLVPASVVSRHPELFSSPNTDLRQLSMSFTIAGPRITSHDIQAATTDYTMKGDGWFDLDKRIDMQARLLLSPAFSRELIAARKNVAYLTNRQDEVDIPVRISGQLPKPAVTPDVQDIAKRAAQHLIQKKAEKLLGGSLGKKLGLPAPSASPSAQPGSPLAPLRKLFH